MSLQATLEQRLHTLIERWTKILRIQDYKVTIEFVPARKIKNAYARVSTDEETRVVDIEFNKVKLTNEPNEVEKTVIHELLHTRINEYADLMESLVDTHVRNPKTKRLIKRKMNLLEHKIVVALTDALGGRNGTL